MDDTFATDQEALEERIRNLALALESRTVIGQATGILIERYSLTAQAAFATLLRVSQHSNRKVYELAREVVTHGHAEGL